MRKDQNRTSRSEELGIIDPPRTRWIGFPPAIVRLVVAVPLAGLALAAMVEGTKHADDPRGVAVLVFGATALISVFIVFIGISRDVRAKDAGRRLEVRLERIIELQLEGRTGLVAPPTPEDREAAPEADTEDGVLHLS